MPREIKRNIKDAVSNSLWGRAAARCQFDGCNKALWKSDVTQESVNVAQKAHIYSFADNGPRGHAGLNESKLNDADNLMLVCHACHRAMDQAKDGGRYTAVLLQGWKAAHEARIERVTGITASKRSHVLLFGANIGEQASPLEMAAATDAMFPHRYPAETKPLALGMLNSTWRDAHQDFWTFEESNLTRQFNDNVQRQLMTGDIKHLSVFGLAPQPLLIRLGTLLSDIQDAEVYQLHREPRSWAWTDDQSDAGFTCRRPTERQGPAALVLSLSATITHDRVTQVLGDDAAIWQLTIAKPHNDFLQSRDQLSAFRRAIRPLMDEIKAAHGQQTPLHIFPAMPVATAIDLGRTRMPKADMPWRIYDQVSERGGFVHALNID